MGREETWKGVMYDLQYRSISYELMNIITTNALLLAHHFGVGGDIYGIY